MCVWYLPSILCRGTQYTPTQRKCIHQENTKKGKEIEGKVQGKTGLGKRAGSTCSFPTVGTVYLQTLQWLFSGFVFRLLSFTLSHKNFFRRWPFNPALAPTPPASPTLDTLVKRLFLFNLCALAWKIWYDSHAKGCSAFETRNLELPPFWQTVEKQPPCMGTGQCHAELTHSAGFQRRTNQHRRRRRRERAKKIQSALPFRLTPCYLCLIFFFFGYHISLPCRLWPYLFFHFNLPKFPLFFMLFHKARTYRSMRYSSVQFS